MPPSCRPSLLLPAVLPLCFGNPNSHNAPRSRCGAKSGLADPTPAASVRGASPTGRPLVGRAEVGDDHSHRAAADSAGHLEVKSGGSKVGEFVGASVEERAQLRGLSGGVAQLRGGGPAKSLPAGTAPVGAPAVREDVRAVRF